MHLVALQVIEEQYYELGKFNLIVDVHPWMEGTTRYMGIPR